MNVPSIRVSATVRIPGCYEPTCEVFDAGPPETYEAVGPVGCIKCWPYYINYPDCVPCRSEVLLGDSYWGNSNIVYTAANPRDFNATCDYSWNEGWYALDRNCGPGSPEFKCYDGTTLAHAGCAFLQYQTVSRQQVFNVGNFKRCDNLSTASNPVVTSNGLYGFLCDGCNDEPQPCCCGDCTDCYAIFGQTVTFENQNNIKLGRIRGSILQMVPCSGPTLNPLYWCGGGCTGDASQNGYSRITVQLMADVPTAAVDANTIFRTDGGLIPNVPGRVTLPRALSFAQLGLADEDGEFWCVATSSITLTFTRCRSESNSLSNVCAMEKGIYNLAYIGTPGLCPISGPECVPVVGTPCNTKEMLDLLSGLGWGVTIEVL